MMQRLIYWAWRFGVIIAIITVFAYVAHHPSVGTQAAGWVVKGGELVKGGVDTVINFFSGLINGVGKLFG